MAAIGGTVLGAKSVAGKKPPFTSDRA